jgi:translation initiation factor 1
VRRDDDVRIVYSTETGFVAPIAPRTKPAQKRGGQALPDDGVIRVAREHRRASSVTLVHGLAPADVQSIGAELRKTCGTGGTAKNGVVELQGDHRDAVVAFFAARGRTVKRAGG